MRTAIPAEVLYILARAPISAAQSSWGVQRHALPRGRRAVLLGSRDINDYEPKHLIYASGAQNVGLAGPGKIDGQGSAF